MNRWMARCSFTVAGECHHSQTPMVPSKAYCRACEHYTGPSRGLGDSIAKTTDRMGIKQCAGCGGRRKVVNKVIRYG